MATHSSNNYGDPGNELITIGAANQGASNEKSQQNQMNALTPGGRRRRLAGFENKQQASSKYSHANLNMAFKQGQPQPDKAAGHTPNAAKQSTSGRSGAVGSSAHSKLMAQNQSSLGKTRGSVKQDH